MKMRIKRCARGQNPGQNRPPPKFDLPAHSLYEVAMILKRAAIILLLLLAPVPSLAAQQVIFGHTEHPATDEHGMHRYFGPMWQRALQQEQADPTFDANGSKLCAIDAGAWKNLVNAAKSATEPDILRMINGFFNQWLPKSDESIWGEPEYWSSPYEFILHRGGDCEDFATAKYFALRYLGFEAERMRIIIIRQLNSDGSENPDLHAVLAVRRAETWLILDNNAKPRDNLFLHTHYGGRFKPLYGVNENSAWVYTPSGK